MISITGSSGVSAIVEYIDGKQVIHHSRDCQVMTNEPSFEKQLILQEYQQSVASGDSLPGSSLSVDRFARVNCYQQSMPPQVGVPLPADGL